MKITKTEKKIRIRTSKRVNYKLNKDLPVSKIGIKILNIVKFIEKLYYK
jgi:hypothetical protein